MNGNPTVDEDFGKKAAIHRNGWPSPNPRKGTWEDTDPRTDEKTSLRRKFCRPDIIVRLYGGKSSPFFSAGADRKIPGEGRSRGPPFGLAGDSGRGMFEARKRAGREPAVAGPRPIRQPAYIPSIFSAYRSVATFFLIFMVGVRMPLSMVNSGTIRTFFTVSKEASSRFLSATSVSMS